MNWSWIILITLTFFSGCTSHKEPIKPISDARPVRPQVVTVPHSGRTKIAVILPFTTNNLSHALLDAINLAILDSALASKLEIVVFNSDNISFEKLTASLREEQVKLVLGPLLTHEISGLMPYLDKLDLKMLAFSNNRELSHQNLYLLGISPQQQIKHLIKHALAEDYKKLFLLLPADQNGRAYASLFQQALKDKKTYIAGIEFYPPTNWHILLAMKSLHNKIQLSPEKKILFFAETGNNLKTILNYFVETEIRNIPDLTVMAFREIQNSKPLPMEGLPIIKLVGGSLEEKTNFEHKFCQTYGYFPPLMASIAYDGAMTALHMLEKKSFSRAALENINGFSGIDGVFRFQDGKSLAKRYFNIGQYSLSLDNTVCRLRQE